MDEKQLIFSSSCSKTILVREEVIIPSEIKYGIHIKKKNIFINNVLFLNVKYPFKI